MEDLLALAGEAGGLIRHETAALGGANGLAEIGLAAGAELALAALGGVKRDDVVAWGNLGNALTDGLNNTASLVAQDRREETLGVYRTLVSLPPTFIFSYRSRRVCRRPCGN